MIAHDNVKFQGTMTYDSSDKKGQALADPFTNVNRYSRQSDY